MRRYILSLGALLLLVLSGVTAYAQGTTHTVQAGENLFRISIRYSVAMADIISANSITNANLIFPGQVLNIPGAGGGTTTPITATPVPTGDTSTGTTTYTVVRGDTLGSIARRFGTTYQAIATANSIANPNLIFVGQILNIPGTAGGTTPGTTPPPSTAPTTGFALGGQVFGFRYPDLMRGTGMTWAKMQVVYNQGDPASIAQDAINAARSRGFKILLSIKGQPAQIAANPTQYYQDFATFLGGVAALGADGIEVWNEMNIDREWPSGLISGAQYTQMLSAAYTAIKNSNSSTLVISGAPAPTGFFGGCSTSGCDDDAYLRAMASAGASQFMDCVGIHYNAGTVPPTATSGAPVGSSGHYSWYYPSMVQVYSSAFPGKPLCFTEIGYLTGEGIGALPAGFSWASDNTVAEQATWLASAVTQARSAGNVNLFIVWNVDNSVFTTDPQAGYAIVRPDGTCPACNTIAQAMQ